MREHQSRKQAGGADLSDIRAGSKFKQIAAVAGGRSASFI
jgi:hypothetical protein